MHGVDRVERQVVEPLMVFVSYARADGTPFVDELVGRLMRLDPPCAAWVDRDDPQDASFSPRIDQALLGCDAVLYVMTRLAETREWCDLELTRANLFRRTIIPLRVHAEATQPALLGSRDPVDFVGDETRAWQDLRSRLDRLRSPTDEIRRMREEVAELEREAANATGSARHRSLGSIGKLRTSEQDARRRIDDPQLARQRVQDGVHRARAERPDRAVPREDGPVRVIGTLPPKPMTVFHDRFFDTAELIARLRKPSVPLVTMIGGVGAGKTAMIFKMIETAQDLAFSTIVYLSTRGLRPVDVTTVMQHLAEVPADPAVGERLARVVADRAVGWLQRLRTVLDELHGTRVLLVVDCAEELVDRDGRRLRDTQLEQLFAEVAIRGHGNIKVLLFAAAPMPVLRGLPAGADRYTIGEGLQFPYSIQFLFDLDQSLADEMPEAVRRELHERTGGGPRLIELVFAVLQGEPTLTVPDLLRDLPPGPPETLAAALLLRAVGSLHRWARWTLVALAVYGRPVRAEAVNHLLAPYIDGYDSAADLADLHGRRLVRRDGAHYFVSPGVERDCVLRGVPAGGNGVAGRPVFERRALYAGAADYFARTLEGTEHPGDLGPEMAQIALRLAAGQHRKAFKVIDRIDRDVLRGWGLSGTLVAWRVALVESLTGADAAYNHSGLATAYIQLGRLRRAAAQVERAERLMEAVGDDQNLILLKIQMAAVLFRRFHLSEALRHYQDARDAAERTRHRVGLAQAIEGVGLCLAEQGRLTEAVEHYGAALAAQQDSRSPDPQARARLLLNLGDCYAQLGRTPDALHAIRAARRLATAGHPALAARCLDAEAFVLIDDGRLHAAIELAGRALKFAVQTDVEELSRAVGTTLTIAYLCADERAKARDAADSAARYYHSPDPVPSHALQGVAALRQGDRDDATAAFRTAVEQAKTLVDGQRNTYVTLDWVGLAYCGIAVCAEGEVARRYAAKALKAYREARRIAPEGLGAARRAQRLVEELVIDQYEKTPRMIERVVEAAGGR